MKLYASTEAAAKLGVARQTLMSWINTGKIIARKAVLGQGWRFTDADIKAIQAWREAPLDILDLTNGPKAPEKLLPEHAPLRPDLDLFGPVFKGSYPFGPEHPKRLLPHLANGPTLPWSILESAEYLAALAELRARPAQAPVAELSPEQEQAHRLFEQFQKEQGEL